MEPTNDCTLCDNSKGYQTLTDPATPVGGRMEKAVKVSSDGEVVSIDRDVLKDAATEAFPEVSVEKVVDSTTAIAAGGMAVFEKPSEAEGEAPGIAMPWVAISDLAQSLRGLPPELRSSLGLDRATTGEEAASALKGSFPYVPEWLVGGGAPSRFLLDSPGLVAPGFDTFDAAPLRPAGLPVSPLGSAEDAKTAVRGLIRGDWNGLGGHWWGWPFGWQVKIDNIPATKLAELLLGQNGGGKLLDVLRQILSAESVSTGVKALSMTAGLAMAIYAAALGANIFAVKNNKGVKLQGNWPVVGGPGAFVWAIRP